MRFHIFLACLPIFFAFPINAQSSDGAPRTEESNKQIVLDYLEIVGNPEFSDWARYFPDSVTFNGTFLPPQALAGILARFRVGFPDLRFSIMGQISEGDRVATWGFFEGTHSGEFNGIPATMRYMRWFAVAVDRLDGGKVVELWHEMDMWGLMRQLQAADGENR